MNSVISRSLEKNKIKKRKSPKNLSLKDEYSKFLKKSKSPQKKSIKKTSPNKKVTIRGIRKNPIFIKTNNLKKPEPKKPEPKKPEPKKPEPKKKNVVSLKSKRRFSKKSKRRKLDKKHTKSRKISFRCYPQKGKNIKEVMKKANKVSDDEMKKELLSNGIEIKGTKNKLLKDIYMFSLLGGIKIQKE